MPEYESERLRSETPSSTEEVGAKTPASSSKPYEPRHLTPAELAKAHSGLLGKPLEPDQVV